MSITSFYFLCFLCVVIIFYYIVPKKLQWWVLLFASVVYYLLGGNPALICYPMITTILCYASGRIIGDGSNLKRKRLGLALGLLGTIGFLFILKYINFGIYTYNGLAQLVSLAEIEAVRFLVPLGISFYTFTMLGYVIDVYFGMEKAADHFFKFALYGLYFPTMISGPILRFREMKDQLYSVHRFQYEQFTFGAQRMLWGFFKKLVISERFAIIANTVYNDYQAYPGIYVWIASFAFLIQLYTDFSGCMDIVLGISQLFGLVLPENFKTPFFSVSISEYWRRWHITLGTWMKDYVFYPILRSRLFQKLGKKNKAVFGKKRGKQITTFMGMFVLWFSVGIWHGGEWNFVIGSGLLHFSYIVIGELLAPAFSRIKEKLSINPKGRMMKVIGMVRTFLLVNFGLIFFRADSVSTAWHMIASMFTKANFRILFDGSVFGLGLDYIEFTIAIVSLIIFVIISTLQECGTAIRESIAGKKIIIRWIIWYALLFYVILLGYYGPGYSVQEFIYKGF